MKLQEIKNIDIANKKVFIRCDFNVPMDEYNNITDDRRIRSALNTIRYCEWVLKTQTAWRRHETVYC